MAGLGRDATARVRRVLRPLGLGAQQYLILEQLQALVARTRDAADRRRYVLRPSRAGERLLRRTNGAIAAAEDDLLAPSEPEQREQLYALLRRVADGVELCPAADDDACDG